MLDQNISRNSESSSMGQDLKDIGGSSQGKNRGFELSWVYRWLLCTLLLWGMGLVFLTLFAPLWTELLWHEVLGLVVCALVLVHLKLNWWFFDHIKTWFKQLCSKIEGIKSRSAPIRTVRSTLIVNLRWLGIKFNELLLIVIGLGLMGAFALTLITGIITSQELFIFIPWEKLGSTFNNIGWRSLHMMFAYYLLVFVSLHTGLHLHTLFAFLPKKLSWLVKSALLIIAIHGAQVWYEGDYVAYLLGQTMFSFWDYDAPIVWFFTDKLAVVALLSGIVYLMQRVGFSLASLEG